MKEVVKVSISGIAFSFEADAYEAMNNFLTKLESGYANNPDGKEIIADIEARIAELILDKQPCEKSVSKELAESIIEQIGYPEEINDADKHEPTTEEIPRRLYRSSEGAKIGGVCAGLGKYFNVDPTWLRVGIFVPLLLCVISGPLRVLGTFTGFFGSVFGMFVMLYFILWIAIPKAKSPRQKLEMRGEKITANSIEQTIKEAAATIESSFKSEKSANVWAEITYVLGRIFSVIIKVVAIILAFSIGLVMITLLTTILAITVGNGSVGGETFWSIVSYIEGISPAAFVILTLIAISIPLIVIVYQLIRVISNSKPNRSFLTVMGISWIVIVLYLLIISINNADNLKRGFSDFRYEIEYWDDRWDDDYWDDDRFEESESPQQHTVPTEKRDTTGIAAEDAAFFGNDFFSDTPKSNTPKAIKKKSRKRDDDSHVQIGLGGIRVETPEEKVYVGIRGVRVETLEDTVKVGLSGIKVKSSGNSNPVKDRSHPRRYDNSSSAKSTTQTEAQHSESAEQNTVSEHNTEKTKNI